MPPGARRKSGSARVSGPGNFQRQPQIVYRADGFVAEAVSSSTNSGGPLIYRAPWVLPIAQPPLRDGWVAVEDGRITGVGSGGDVPSATEVLEVTGAIMPGLVNAHTHLELSWMRGQVPPAPSMPRWVERLMALRRTVGHEPAEPIVAAIGEAREAGTTLVGDITNTLAAYGPLMDSPLSAAVFRELLGFNVEDPNVPIAFARQQIDELRSDARLRPSIVPHAPYSVAASLLRTIAEASRDARVSIHLGESTEEIEFLQTGQGAWRELLQRLGVWTETWQPPRTGPVDYIASCGLLDERLLAVHCVQLTDAELHTLASAGATVVTCPRSNRWVGAGLPPVERFYASGV